MLIGIAGRAGVGKSTVAKELASIRGFTICPYAAPLKEGLSVLTGLPMRHFTDINYKEQPSIYGPTPREMMQKCGTDFIRMMINSDFWTMRMKVTLKHEIDFLGGDVVIDDCRFENETQLVRDHGGVVVHLEREFESPTEKTNHASEQVLKYHKGDIVISSGKYPVSWTYTKMWEELQNAYNFY